MLRHAVAFEAVGPTLVLASGELKRRAQGQAARSRCGKTAQLARIPASCSELLDVAGVLGFFKDIDL